MVALALLALAWGSSPLFAATQATYYVAPNGSDTNPGTLVAPFLTLGRARDVVRTVNAAMTGDIVVYLRGGTYPVGATIVFGTADSGSGGFSVKYVGYPGERPLLTGGTPLMGWTLSDAAKNIYVSTGVSSRFRQLYVNGVKAIRARTPNLGPAGAPNFNRITGADLVAHNVQVAASAVAPWGNLTKVELHLMVNWGDSVLRLASYSTSGANALLKFQSTEDGILFQRPYPILNSVRQVYYFENAYEFIDVEGEWYLDETARSLYYKPRAGEDMRSATVVAPMVETLLSVVGTSTTAQAHHIWFQGLTFAHSTYLRASDFGFLDAQAGQYNLTANPQNQQTVGRPAAGVSVRNANNVRFERNVLGQMAATALDFQSGTHDDVVIGNVFTDVGGSGISLGKFTQDESTEYHVPYNPADPNEISTSDRLEDNYISGVTTEIQGACGIAAGYPRLVVIQHNEISYVNYTGISVGFGWTLAPNAMSNNQISYNNIHHIANVLADGGGIYTLSNQGPMSLIQYNYLHDFTTPTWADYADFSLYLDEGTSGYTVSHNVIANAPAGVHFNGTAAYNTQSDNDAAAATTIAAAGIEPAYADIKASATIPIPVFPSSSGGGGGTGGTPSGGSQATGGAQASGGAGATSTNGGGGSGVGGQTGTAAGSGGTGPGSAGSIGTMGAAGGSARGGAGPAAHGNQTAGCACSFGETGPSPLAALAVLALAARMHRRRRAG